MASSTVGLAEVLDDFIVRSVKVRNANPSAHLDAITTGETASTRHVVSGEILGGTV
jgi:hypothetical protein